MKQPSNRVLLLEKRRNALAKAPFRGKSPYLNDIAALKPQLTKLQKEYLVGLVLGDASMKFNHNIRTARFQIQQRSDRRPFLEQTRQVFLEYMPNDNPLSNVSAARNGMIALQSLQCNAIYEFVTPLFYPGVPKSQEKTVTPGVKDYISPLSLAILVCGDGSKADSTPNSGKGISLHTQGFPEDQNNILANAISANIGLKTLAKCHNTTKKWHIDISGTSYEDFCEKAGPWVIETFHYRIPTGRSGNSRHGYMTPEKRQQCLGTALKDLEDKIESYIG